MSECAPAASEALAVLPPARELGGEHGGDEVLGAGIVEGNLHVSLRRADVAQHIGRIDALEAGPRGEAVVEKARALFAAERERPTDIGRTNAIS
jgi:hypothetical protein